MDSQVLGLNLNTFFNSSSANILLPTILIDFNSAVSPSSISTLSFTRFLGRGSDMTSTDAPYFP